MGNTMGYNMVVPPASAWGIINQASWKVLDKPVFLLGIHGSKVVHLSGSGEEPLRAHLVIENGFHRSAGWVSRIRHFAGVRFQFIHGHEFIRLVLLDSREDIRGEGIHVEMSHSSLWN